MPYDIEGEKVDADLGEDGWFDYEGGAGPLGAHVELDPQKAAENAHKLPVLMLRRAKKQAVGGKPGGYIANAAICEAGSHIRVVLRAHVTWGLEFEAETAADRKLGNWFTLVNQPNQLIYPAVDRYDPKYSGSTYTSIKVDDVPTLERKFPGVQWSQWFVFTVRAHNITGFIDESGKQFGTRLKPQGETTSVTVGGAGANPGDPLQIDETKWIKPRELFLAPGLPMGVNFRLFVYANADLIRQNVKANEMASLGGLR